MSRKEMIRVSSKGQIVLPKKFRDDLGIEEGDYVAVYELGQGTLLLERAPASPLDALTADLRQEAKERKFTREELESMIESRRSGQKSDAA